MKVAFGWLWGGFKVAFGWLWGAYPLAINTLWGGFEVALAGFGPAEHRRLPVTFCLRVFPTENRKTTDCPHTLEYVRSRALVRKSVPSGTRERKTRMV
jgi:hypothetical protein